MEAHWTAEQMGQLGRSPKGQCEALGTGTTGEEINESSSKG